MHITKILTPFARRFVAGEKAEDALVAVQNMNALGLSAIVDFLGEDVERKPSAAAAADEYIRLLKMLQTYKVKAAISIKMSQMGLLISEEFCVENFVKVLATAAKDKTFVWVDMEGSALTQRTIDLFDKLRSATSHIGLCLQAYLVRTGADLDRLMRRSLNVRLCKGAYKESPAIAFPTKRAVDGNYRMLAQKLMDHAGKGVYPAFATHDPFLIDYLTALAGEKKVPPNRFEFQMLYGIQNRLLRTLTLKGYQGNVYIPYGTAWLGYFMRRLRERKENAYFLMKNLFQK